MSIIWGVDLVQFEILEAAKWRGCIGDWKCESKAPRGGSSKGTY